nr:serine/threonine-protein kinase ATR-like [Quercus suber]
MQRTEVSLDCDSLHLQSLFFKLLCDESSEEVQVACVSLIQRIHIHGNTDVLLKTRSEWTKCIDFLLLNRKKAVREAFSAEDPPIFDTLLESTAEIMIAVDIYSQLFLFSLFLLVDQLDNPHVTVRMNVSRTCEENDSFVLPKLVVSQQDNEQAIETLYELAKYLNTDMVLLIVNWLPKVLAFALHQAALPALLDELVCFLDEGGSDEIRKRLARVPQMIKEVARVLTDGEDLPGFLRNHFVGLNIIDRKMLHAEDTSLQQQTLKQIEILIKMMGSQLSTSVPKLMVLLMHAIDEEPLQSEGLSILLMPGNVRKNLI